MRLTALNKQPEQLSININEVFKRLKSCPSFNLKDYTYYKYKSNECIHFLASDKHSKVAIYKLDKFGETVSIRRRKEKYVETWFNDKLWYIDAKGSVMEIISDKRRYKSKNTKFLGFSLVEEDINSYNLYREGVILASITQLENYRICIIKDPRISLREIKSFFSCLSTVGFEEQLIV